jgi:threonine dehydrogenase-like Zn-dependent dehydrogenase
MLSLFFDGLGVPGGKVIVTDPNDKALELAEEWGADETVKVASGYFDTVLEMTDGKGAEVVFDYVGERGAEDNAWQMTQQGGYHHVASATAARSRSRPQTSSPPSAAESVTWSVPTTTSPS